MKKLLVCLIFLLSACANAATEVTSTTLIPTTQPTESATPLQPTDTPEPSPTQPPIRYWSDLPYAPEGGARQMLDVYLPETGDGPFPTILAIHGGGFRTRSKSLYSRMAAHLNELGYAVVATNYRLVPKYSYPAQVEDVFCALAWVHTNHATYGFDVEHTFVTGGSAGGYLAAMLGTVDTPSAYLENCPHSLPASDWIQGVVVFYGFYNFTGIDGDPFKKGGVDGYWGAKYDEISPETLAEMSPMSWVDGSEPPFLLIHGTLDTDVPSQMSEDFAAVLEDVGVDVELLLLDARHAFELKPLSSPEMQQSLETIEAFLSAQLMK